MSKFEIYYRVFKRFIRTQSLKKARFLMYELDMHVSMYDDDMLIAQLGYFGHHVEKALKHHNRDNRGEQKRDKLELLIKEFAKRNIAETKIVQWANNLVEYYDANKTIYIEEISHISIHPQKDAILNFIKNRVTTRFWQSRDIDDDIIRDILETSMSSALSCNRQTIRFAVVKNKIQNIVLGDSNNQSMFNKAPVIIYIAEDERFFNDLFETTLDVGSVCSMIMIAAHFYGIAGTWIYQSDYYNDKKLRDELGLSQNHRIYSVITLGYPADKQEKPPRFKIHYDCKESIHN